MAKLTDSKIAQALRGGTIPTEFLLGYGVVSTVPDTPVSGVKLVRVWGASGVLDPELVPRKREPVHAFQTACRSVETRRRSNGESKTTEVKVDEIVNNPDECVYQITRMVRDRENRIIEHPKAMRIVYSKPTGDITAEPLDRSTYRLLRGLEDAIRNHFEQNASKVPGSKVREAIRRTLANQGATLLRRTGSFYFVPVEAREHLMALRDVLEQMYGDHDAGLIMLPQVNGDYEREMIEKHYTMNASSEIDAMLAEVVNYRKRGQVREDKLNNLIAQRANISGTVEKYKGLLNSELSEVEEKVDLLTEALEKLYEEKVLA